MSDVYRNSQAGLSIAIGGKIEGHHHHHFHPPPLPPFHCFRVTIFMPPSSFTSSLPLVSFPSLTLLSPQLQAGYVAKGDKLLLMPLNEVCQVKTVRTHEVFLHSHSSSSPSSFPFYSSSFIPSTSPSSLASLPHSPSLSSLPSSIPLSPSFLASSFSIVSSILVCTSPTISFSSQTNVDFAPAGMNVELGLVGIELSQISSPPPVLPFQSLTSSLPLQFSD